MGRRLHSTLDSGLPAASTSACRRTARGAPWRRRATRSPQRHPWGFHPLQEGPFSPRKRVVVYTCFPSRWLLFPHPTPQERKRWAASPASPSPRSPLTWVVKLFLTQRIRLAALQGKRGAETARDSQIKWFVSNFLPLPFCWAKGRTRNSYRYLQRMCFYIAAWLQKPICEQEELPFKLALATTAGLQVLPCKKLTAHYAENLTCFLIFLSCKTLLSFISFYFLLFYFIFSTVLLFAKLFDHFAKALQNAKLLMPAGPCW